MIAHNGFADSTAGPEDTDWISRVTVASNNVDVVLMDVVLPARHAGTWTDPYWDEDPDVRALRLRREEEHRLELVRRRRERRRRPRERLGNGHDPRRQVVCRVRCQSRGEGRR